MENMIITSECEECAYSVINDENKAKVKIFCKEKNKTYYLGQCVPCDCKNMKGENDNGCKN